MKNKILYFTLAILSFGFFACEDDNVGPTFTVDAEPAITAPTTGEAYVFTGAQADDPFETVTWTAAQFSPSNLQKPVYRLQLDFAGNNFASPIQLASTSDLSYQTTVGTLNGSLVAATHLFGSDSTLNLEMRVKANIENTAVDNIFSNVVSMTVTIYNTEVNTVVSPIYLLGSASTAGWDNNTTLELTPLPDGKFKIYTQLLGGTGQQIKFIADQGAWAPQWGTDGAGTWDSGALVYRPDEAAPDPAGIPAPPDTGYYEIIADTAALTYLVTKVDLIYLLGDGTTAGWSNTAAIPLVPIDAGIYTIITELSTGGPFWKIIDELGAWAPQWGTDATATWESGPLVYRPDEATPDPAAIPAPPTPGMYKIVVDLNTLTYTVTAQ